MYPLIFVACCMFIMIGFGFLLFLGCLQISSGNLIVGWLMSILGGAGAMLTPLGIVVGLQRLLGN